MESASQKLTYNTSIKLIHKAIQEKYIKPLALWHLMKANYSNSAIYSYKNRMDEIAFNFEISTKTLYTCLSVLREKELAIDFKNNLNLISIHLVKKVLKDRKKTKIKLTSIKTEPLWLVVCRLYAKAVEVHIKKIVHNEAVRRVSESFYQDKKAFGERSFRPSLSIRNTAELLNLSITSTRKVLKTLEELQIIKLTKPRARKISDSQLPIKLISDYPGYRFVTHKGTFEMNGAEYNLIEYPVSMPKLTAKIILNTYNSINCKK